MVLVDLRNHGKSAGIEGLDPPYDMVNAAKDLASGEVSRMGVARRCHWSFHGGKGCLRICGKLRTW